MRTQVAVLVCDNQKKADKARTFLLGMGVESEDIKIIATQNFNYDGDTYNAGGQIVDVDSNKVIVIGWK